MADTTRKVMERLNKQIAGVKGRTTAGLMAGGLIVERQAKIYTPREYGNLVGSAFTRKAIDGTDSVEVGFSAAYAVYVHENLQQKLKGEPRPSGLGVYWGPNGRPRFLYVAYVEKQKEVLAVVKKYAEIKS